MGELQQEIALLLWLMCVNGAPIILKKLVGDRFQQPLDWNQSFFDGRPILGSSKTFRGVASALLMSVLIAASTRNPYQPAYYSARYRWRAISLRASSRDV